MLDIVADESHSVDDVELCGASFLSLQRNCGEQVSQAMARSKLPEETFYKFLEGSMRGLYERCMQAFEIFLWAS